MHSPKCAPHTSHTLQLSQLHEFYGLRKVGIWKLDTCQSRHVTAKHTHDKQAREEHVYENVLQDSLPGDHEK